MSHLLLCDGTYLTVTNYHWPDLENRIRKECFEIESNTTICKSTSINGGLADEDIVIIAKPVTPVQSPITS